MPFLDPQKLEAIPTRGLQDFTPEDLLLVDEKDRTLLYRLLEDLLPTRYLMSEVVTDPLGPKLMKELLEGNHFMFHPYIYNRDRNAGIYIPVKSSTVGKGRQATEKIISKAHGLAGPLDFTILNAESEVAYSNGPNTQLANALLKLPIKIPEPYFSRIYATLIKGLKSANKLRDRIQLIGSYTSLLIGMDVLEILKGKHDVYHGHVQAYPDPKKKSSSGEYLNGFLPYHFLPLRIFFTMQLLLNLQLKEINDTSLQEFVKPPELSTPNAVRDYLILQIKKELKRNLQTYWISRSGYYINSINNVPFKTRFLSSMAQGVVESIKALEENDSVILYLAWEGEGYKKAKEEDHALYLHIHKKDSKWNVLIHNLGAYNHLHPTTSKEGSQYVYPYGLGRLDPKAWEADGAGFKYIEAVLTVLYGNTLPLSKRTKAWPTYYDKEKKGDPPKILVGPHVQKLEVEKEYEAAPEQRAPNCVYENGTATRKITLSVFYDWVQREESRQSAIYERFKIPDFSRDCLLLLSQDPSDTILLDTDPKASFIADPIKAFRDAYSSAYEYIPSVSHIWDAKPMKMEDYYVELSLVEGTRPEQSTDTVNELRPIHMHELLAHGGQQWIEGQFGAGKSTLLQYFAWLWAKNKAEISHYDLVILIPLRQLESSLKISGNTSEQRLMSFLGQLYFDYRYDDEIRDLFAKALLNKERRVLYLLDGLNELDPSLKPEVQDILNFIRKQPHVFTSTRPLALSTEERSKPHIVVKGLSTPNISLWLDRHINDPDLVSPEEKEDILKRKKLLLKHLQSNERVWALAHYPIILKIICMALIYGHLDAELQSLAQIYQIMFSMFADHHCSKIGVENERAEEYWDQLEQVLARFALKILISGDRLIKVEPLKKELISLFEKNYKRNWADELMNCGLLTPAKPIGHSHPLVPLYFIHDSFYEYLAAKALVDKMIHKREEFIQWFKTIKHQDYQVVWRFVSGLLKDPDIANQWFLLWLDYPLARNPRSSTLYDNDQVATLISESPLRTTLPLRQTLLTYVKSRWNDNILAVPNTVAALMKATNLWTHEEAAPWITQIKAALTYWNEALPHPKLKSETPKKLTTEANRTLVSNFYESIHKASRLLKDIYDIDPRLVHFLEDNSRLSIDLKLRTHGNTQADTQEIDKKLDTLSKEDYLPHRLRMLTAIIKIKMNIHDEKAIEQFEEALLWGAQYSYTKELLRLSLTSIASHKLNSDKINSRLYSFFKTFKRGKEYIETLRLLVDALASQVSKDPSILKELSKFIKKEEEPALLKHILETLSAYHYADVQYVRYLLDLLPLLEAEGNNVATDVIEALHRCEIDAPALPPSLKEKLRIAFSKYIDLTSPQSLKEAEGPLPDTKMYLQSEEDMRPYEALHPEELALIKALRSHAAVPAPPASLSKVLEPPIGSKRPRADSQEGSENESDNAMDFLFRSPPKKRPPERDRSRASASGSRETIAYSGHLYQVNCEYEYEDQDITAILNARLKEYNHKQGNKPVFAMAAIDDTLTPNALLNRLLKDKNDHRGSRIILIPCNLSRFHWVGFLFEFNDHNQCERAECINSMPGSIPSTFLMQIQQIYPGLGLTERQDLIQQNDGKSCGPCTVENLILSMTKASDAPSTTMAKIRARHLSLLQKECEEEGLSEHEKARRITFFKEFDHRQHYNIPTFDSTRYPGFKDNKRTKSEMIAIARLTSLITLLEKEIQEALRKVLTSPPGEDEDQEHKDVLDQLRTIFWSHGDHPQIQALSLRFFGITKSAAIDTQEKFMSQSQLLFDYNYLKDIGTLLNAPEELAAFLAMSPEDEPPGNTTTPLFSLISGMPSSSGPERSTDTAMDLEFKEN